MRALFLTLFLVACPSDPPEASHDHSGHDHDELDAGQHEPAAGHGAHVEALGSPPTGDPGTGEYRVNKSANDYPPSTSDIGAFRLTCKYSHLLLDDPIVFPGQPGKAHAHVFYGNKGTNAHSTYETLRNSGASTCRGGIAQRSAYWVPAVIADGVYLKPLESHYYYKKNHYNLNDSVKLSPMPAGIRVVTGDMSATSPQNTSNVAFKCWSNYSGLFSGIKDKKCPDNDQVSMEIVFPNCSNGQLDSSDHRSHVAWPVNGRCPSSHPTAIPAVSFHVLWSAKEINAARDVKLSSDKGKGGYSLHGDWMEAWDPTLPPVFTQKCLNDKKDCGSHRLGNGWTIY